MERLKSFYYQLLKIKNRLFSGRPVLVLMYHRIHDFPENYLKHLSVAAGDFEKQLLYFKENFEILRLDENWNNQKKTAIVLTFDDGYIDNLEIVLPLLEKYNIPATFFITTENIPLGKTFWWDRLAMDFSQLSDSYLLPDLNIVTKQSHDFKKLNNIITNLSNDERENWLGAFEAVNKISFDHHPKNRTLNFQELRQLAQHPLIQIGLHSHAHNKMGDMNFEKQKEDIALNQRILKDEGIKTIDFIAMPHGSYNEETLSVATDLNLKGILLANNYYSNRKNKKSGRIFRILMPSISDNLLSKYIGKFDF